MAGRARSRAVLENLTQRGEKDELTALEYVAQRVVDGGTVLEVAEEVQKDLKMTPAVSYGMVMRALGITNSAKEVDAVMTEARRKGAYAKVEKAERIADDVATDKDAIAKAKLRAEVRMWSAERTNRDTFGSAKAPTVQINIGDLHIDALRRLQPNEAGHVDVNDIGSPAPVTAIVGAPAREWVEAEVVPNEELELDALLG